MTKPKDKELNNFLKFRHVHTQLTCSRSCLRVPAHTHLLKLEKLQNGKAEMRSMLDEHKRETSHLYLKPVEIRYMCQFLINNILHNKRQYRI